MAHPLHSTLPNMKTISVSTIALFFLLCSIAPSNAFAPFQLQQATSHSADREIKEKRKENDKWKESEIKNYWPRRPAKPSGYAPKFFSIHARQTIDPATDTKTGLQSHIRWYDFDQLAMKDECSMTGITSTALFLNRTIYIFNPALKRCTILNSIVTIVTPDWIVKDAEFKGHDMVNGIPTYRWEKLNHTFWETRHETPYAASMGGTSDYYNGFEKPYGGGHGKGRRVVRVYTPLDQNGQAGIDDFAVYEPVERHAEGTFYIPSYCIDPEPVSPVERIALFPCHFYPKPNVF